MKIENKEDGKKIVELTREDQKDLFCVAWQFTNFWEDLKEHKATERLACGYYCPYAKDCHDNNRYHIYDQFRIMTKLTGIEISPISDLRKEVGDANFLKEVFKSVD